MKRLEIIAGRIVAVSMRKSLFELLPPEVFRILMEYDQKTQGEVLVALQMQEKLTIQLQTLSRGDRARMGKEEGWILAVNDRIVAIHESNPAGTNVIESPRRWDEYRGNHIEMAKYERSWDPLD